VRKTQQNWAFLEPPDSDGGEPRPSQVAIIQRVAEAESLRASKPNGSFTMGRSLGDRDNKVPAPHEPTPVTNPSIFCVHDAGDRTARLLEPVCLLAVSILRN
jgi:hypothetical protein